MPHPLVIQSPILASPDLIHGFSTRAGGFSKPPFDSLNMSDRTGDDPDAVMRNCALILDRSPGMKLATLNQTHGSNVLVLENNTAVETGVNLGDFDAIVTARSDVLIGIKTADCTPILLYDRCTGSIGAIHAGWRGTAKQIARATVETMSRAFGAKPGDITAVIGPSIGACCYTVGDELVLEFEKAFGAGRFVETAPDGLEKADIRGANRSILINAGVLDASIATIDLCTACNGDLFFSHRRDGEQTGRHISFIGTTR